MAGVISCKQHCVIPVLRSLSRQRLTPCSYVLVQQLRHKGSKRFVLPPQSKDKEKWVSRAKKELKVEEMMPPKELEKFMSRVPEDDVWIRKHYPSPRYQLVDTLLMHRELASPEMMNNTDGLVVTELELDMSTKKKTKFLSSITGTVLFPHTFDDGIVNRVIALTKSREQQEVAQKMGATYVGGLEIIKLIERGEIRHDDYDRVVCDVDIMTEVALIKKHLKDHFPQRKKGTLGPDIGAMVNLFIKGRTFESRKESEALARLSQPFGKLNMSDEELRENFQILVDTVCSVKAQAHGKLIRKVLIRCPPSVETFHPRDSEFVPRIASATGQTGRDPAVNDAGDEEDEMEEAPEELERDEV